MTRWLIAAGIAFGFALGTARAGGEEDETFSGHRLPPVAHPSGHGTISAEVAEAFGATREFVNIVYIAADALKLEPKFVNGAREGLKKLYLRDYKGAKDHFAALEVEFPGTAVSPVADTLVWQALMIENFDFKFEKQYQTSSKRARSAIGEALKKPGAEAWEHFLMAGIVGIEGIHATRKESWVPAMQLAFEAMEHMQKSKEAATDFPDLLLADGVYNYWRTIITKTSKVLPDFGDHRVEGIQQMEAVEERAFFIAPVATLALAFSWIEERDQKRAITACMRNRRAYPDNVINNLVAGRVYVSLGKVDSALTVYDDVLRVAPDNRRVHYYRGVALLKGNRLDEAEKELTAYAAYGELETWQRAETAYRLGQLYYRKKDYARAEEQWKVAVKINGSPVAKARLEKMKEAKKEGTIQ